MGEAALSRPAFVPGVRFRWRAELAWFFSGYESEVGYRTTFGPMLAALNGVAMGGGPPIEWDPMGDVIDRASRTGGPNVIARARRVRDTLQRVQSAHGAGPLIVLHLLYGERPPAFLGLKDCPRCGRTAPTHKEMCDIGAVASILHLTAAAEGAREELALQLGEERESDVRLRVARAPQAATEDFWRLCTRLTTALERRDANRLAEEKRAPLPHDARQVAGEIKLVRKILDGVMKAARRPVANELPSVFSALVGADREVTTVDALRARLTVKDEADAGRFARRAAREAILLRDAAEAAYSTARGAA